VGRAVASGESGPVHHDLFYEAWAQRFDNPLSALVVGVAAAEVGVKNCIAALVPEAAWLAFNVPSPPLLQVLKEYLPSLPVRHINNEVKMPPAAVLDTLAKGISRRNALAHTGKPSPPPEFTEKVLEAIRDLLWLMDYYSGAAWALHYLRDETKSALGVR
jgi:hypothetical protein